MLQQDFYDAVSHYVYRAAQSGVVLYPEDFRFVDGEGITIDGMPAGEWIYAVCEMD